MAVVRELATIHERAGIGIRRLNILRSLIMEQTEFKQSRLGLPAKNEKLALLFRKEKHPSGNVKCHTNL